MRHIVILLIALMSATNISAQQNTSKLGDVDSDGRLTITDVTMMVNYCVGVQPAGFNAAVSDLNHDKETTITDVIILVNLIIGEGTQPQPIDDENPVIPVNPTGGDPGDGV